MPHRILVNDRTLYQTGSGVSMTLRMLLRHWPDNPRCALSGFCTHTLRRRNDWPPRVTAPMPDASELADARFSLTPLSALQPPTRPPASLRRWVQRGYDHALRLNARRGKFAAVWEPNHLTVPTGLPTLTTVHDLSLVEYPEWHPADRVKQWQRDLRRSISATTRWATDSAFSRDRMVAVLGLDAGTIDVIHLAPRPLPFPPPERVAALREAAGLPAKYVVALGSIEPRKNLGLLLEAWAGLDERVRRECRLILAGPAGWGGADFWRGLIGHPMAGEVLTTGYLGDAQTALILAGAAALLMPSHYEGFGLPLVEAMACGTPTIASDIPVFHEVARDAAALLPARDAGAWKEAVLRVLSDDAWLADLSRCGQVRAAAFSWTDSARRYDDAIALAISV
ncbi:MAG: glycosyltransferase family 4 protein [Planctomycetes bacterium]|nr:glycosyltransferase family 4 protein [Planctomycetota bacterium]